MYVSVALGKCENVYFVHCIQVVIFGPLSRIRYGGSHWEEELNTEKEKKLKHLSWVKFPCSCHYSIF